METPRCLLRQKVSGQSLQLRRNLALSESKVELKPNGSTVAQIDVAAGQNLQESNGMANVGLRLMISNNFAPKTRLRMASRLLIMEVMYFSRLADLSSSLLFMGDCTSNNFTVASKFSFFEN